MISYNEMLDRTWVAAKTYEATAKLYECTTPKDVSYVHSVFRGENNTTLMCNCDEHGNVSEVVSVDSPWLEDVVIRMPIKLDFNDACELLYAAGCPNTWVQCVLRNPLGPTHNNPEYIYSYGNGVNVAVDTFTREVHSV